MGQIFANASSRRGGHRPQPGALRRKATSLRRKAAYSCISLASAFAMILTAAPDALADYGRGWWGGVDDKIATSFGLLLVAFFAVLVFVLSVLQWSLDKRKKAHRAAEKARLGDARWRGGW